MHLKNILNTGKTAISFEFFPPRTSKGWDYLYLTISNLISLNPTFVSVTYGAGGATRDRTCNLVTRLHLETGIEVVAHLTCVDHTRDELKSILEKYAENGIGNILALRGDITGDTKSTHGDFIYAAELVHFIRTEHPDMSIGVAGFPEGHPSAVNRLDEINHLKNKVDAGADYIITQLFFDNRDYSDFVARCHIAGIDIPIIAGIMPITSQKNMNKMAQLAPRSRFPAGLIRAIHRAETDKGVENAGTHWAAEQVRNLLDRGVPGIHLYTLNHSVATLRIVQSLGLENFNIL